MTLKTLTRDDWLDIRRQSIGASEAAAACGESPYLSELELYARKLGIWEETHQELERFEAKMKSANTPGQRAFYVTEYARAVIYNDLLQAEIKLMSEMTLAQLASEYIPSVMDCLLRYSPMTFTSAFHNASDLVAREVQKEALQIARNVLEMSKG
jgi:YqaJ-like viral recombinase domain